MIDGEKRCSCGKGCPTFGACLRGKALRISYCQSASGKDATAQKRWDAELDSYQAARAQGVQPAGTTTKQIRQAMELSDMAGKAYNASDRTFT